MRTTKIISMFALPVIAAAFAGCLKSDAHAIDMRHDGNIVMRIPYDTIKSTVFLVTETKGEYYKLENKSYTGDLIISELEKKPFLVRNGVCLKLERPSGEQKAFVNAVAAMCIERNLNLFVDEPGGEDATKETKDINWIVRREK